MISSIGQLLDQMGVITRVFDLGRHIQEISTTTFARFEAQEIPYPAPYLHHAWLGLLFWDPETPEIPLLWFIKLPLDEQGKLVLAERDLFLQQLLVALGANIAASKQGEQLAAVLEGNPYVFTPSPERQAAIHARVNKLLGKMPSDFYAPACAYLKSDLSQWQSLGLQGLADIAVRWPEHQAELLRIIPALPAPALIGLCQCLENESINGALGKSLHTRLMAEIGAVGEEQNIGLIAALIRGLSQCQALELRQKTLLQVLHSSAGQQIEVLAAIGTRCSMDLCNVTLALPFLEALCQQGQLVFNRVLADLLFCAPLRPHLLEAFRQPQRSELLATTIGGLLHPQSAQPGTLH